MTIPFDTTRPDWSTTTRPPTPFEISLAELSGFVMNWILFMIASAFLVMLLCSALIHHYMIHRQRHSPSEPNEARCTSIASFVVLALKDWMSSGMDFFGFVWSTCCFVIESYYMYRDFICRVCRECYALMIVLFKNMPSSSLHDLVVRVHHDDISAVRISPKPTGIVCHHATVTVTTRSRETVHPEYTRIQRPTSKFRGQYYPKRVHDEEEFAFPDNVPIVLDDSCECRTKIVDDCNDMDWEFTPTLVHHFVGKPVGATFTTTQSESESESKSKSESESDSGMFSAVETMDWQPCPTTSTGSRDNDAMEVDDDYDDDAGVECMDWEPTICSLSSEVQPMDIDDDDAGVECKDWEPTICSLSSEVQPMDIDDDDAGVECMDWEPTVCSRSSEVQPMDIDYDDAPMDIDDDDAGVECMDWEPDVGSLSSQLQAINLADDVDEMDWEPDIGSLSSQLQAINLADDVDEMDWEPDVGSLASQLQAINLADDVDEMDWEPDISSLLSQLQAMNLDDDDDEMDWEPDVSSLSSQLHAINLDDDDDAMDWDCTV